ncbi:MAG: leucine--tRNA ligase [Candidatus Nanogingivalaceae bacterium]|nr:MAG: leucine--tRNA ligase [Candidatus Nanogingivalaceae bacterium]QWB91442.1 MAG: leucine--tRNA ligase [Candidatus Nanogingivalaceae bacterium]
MKRYNPIEIEAKWQKKWDDSKLYEVKADPSKQKMYISGMFPYPSGAGLHTGHARSYTIVDSIARFYRQKGKNVLNPIGWDTFGLPAENYAIKTGISPQEATKTNIANFKKQFKRLGISIDWSREINTSNPEYYKWTQWIFRELYKKGLAYRKESYQWWCDNDKTVLANEQVENGRCWRCGEEVTKKRMTQWFFRITAYADELLEDIDNLDWPEKIKTMQRNWIGKSKGVEIEFEIAEGDAKGEKIKVFTTRPDTLFGATFLAVAPEHPLLDKLVNDLTKDKVEEYKKESLKKTEIERQENKQKTGIFTGSYVVNPANGKRIPVWVSDYVLGGYGEGAVMAVPAHDERDYEFAKKFDLDIIKVVEKPEGIADDDICYHGEGVIVNSGDFDGQNSADVREQVLSWLEEKEIGRSKTTYKMRDWLISRQRYWGCPIPIAYDKDGNEHLIPEEQLPVMLPTLTDFKPDDSGKSALAKSEEFMHVEVNGEKMVRETDTMDGYACSSWYLLRYADPRNSERAWDPELVNYWAPVDYYVGGDHAVAHLLYVRFWTHVFKDLGLTNFSEPVKKLLYHGYINAEDGSKMSKSKGNTIDPLEVIDQGYGADSLRTYEMFIAPYEIDASWDSRGIAGVYRFLNRVWVLVQEFIESEKSIENLSNFEEVQKSRHKTIKKVTEDFHRESLNTVVAALMEFVNDLYKFKLEGFSEDWRQVLEDLLKMLMPFAPHISSELWQQLGNNNFIEESGWPEWDEEMLKTSEIQIVVQVNGKLRGKIKISTELEKQQILEKAKQEENVAKFLADKEIIKEIVVPGKLINFVVK